MWVHQQAQSCNNRRVLRGRPLPERVPNPSWRPIALLLTFLTGFSGLVYEVTWQKYLATLLGSHSEATAAVLGIFLAGLSAGYALFGALARRLVARAERLGRPARLLQVYGLVEGAIGVWALGFPLVFGLVRRLSLAAHVADPVLAFLLDLVLATLLVGPPTVLMGGTIPLLTQGLLRNLVESTRVHAWIYGINTAGAFGGALAAGFALVPALGLVRVLVAMGLLNLVAGMAFYVLGRKAPAAGAAVRSIAVARPPGFALYATVACLGGFAMMAVQTVLIRLGGLAFGSSEFTFSMVVAVFVLSIALGGLGVSFLSGIGSRHLLLAQWALAGYLALLYWLLPQVPYGAHVLRTLFGASGVDFWAYHLVSLLVLLALIGPPVALSGAILPLLFHHAKGPGRELGAVAGRLYSWNTVGCLLGATLGGYLLLFWLDLHHVFRLAVGLLFLAAALLTWRLASLPRVATATLAAGALSGLALLHAWDPRLLSAGLFRERVALPESYRGADALVAARGHKGRIVFYDDDPTTSVTVTEQLTPKGMEREIITNGKSDGATIVDYPTMGLAAVIPALFADRPERGFVIGFGTGVTAGELAALDSMREVVVAEISPGVIEAAPWFDYANREASHSPKIRLVRGDAYRVLLRSEARYDVIVSEPSNPWVTGVEMLFSRGFLEAARAHLAPGGAFLQWYHLYETDAASVEMVLRTYAAVFDHVAVWYGLGYDLLLLGVEDPAGALDVSRLERRAARPELAAALHRAGVESFPALLVHELLPLGVVNAAALTGPVHTLEHPRLSHLAGRAFFRGANGRLPFTGVGRAAQLGARNSLLRRYLSRFGGAVPDSLHEELLEEACARRQGECATLLAAWQVEDPASPVLGRLLAQAMLSKGEVAAKLDPRILPQLTALLDASRESRGEVSLEFADHATRLFSASYYHAFPFRLSALVDLWSRCRPVAACRPRLEEARALLARDAETRAEGQPGG